MPRSDGRSFCTTTAWWCFKPSASSVRRSNAGRPIPERTCRIRSAPLPGGGSGRSRPGLRLRSEEHTSELQSQSNIVCRLLLEKKNTKAQRAHHAKISAAALHPRINLASPLHPPPLSSLDVAHTSVYASRCSLLSHGDAHHAPD